MLITKKTSYYAYVGLKNMEETLRFTLFSEGMNNMDEALELSLTKNEGDEENSVVKKMSVDMLRKFFNITEVSFLVIVINRETKKNDNNGAPRYKSVDIKVSI